MSQCMKDHSHVGLKLPIKKKNILEALSSIYLRT